jgi:hypothetical protein
LVLTEVPARYLIKSIADLFHRSQYVSNDVAASIIRGFASATLRDSYEWDDLEMANHSNPDVDLAVRLCWHFASLYPAQKSSEYCAKEAMPCFLAVANALEKGLPHLLDHAEIVKLLKQDKLPDEVARLLYI